MVKARDVVDGIYREAAAEYKLKPKDMIADITGGTKGMGLGMFFACVDGSRDLEFIGTHYDENAKPTDLLPMIFDFEVVNPYEK